MFFYLPVAPSSQETDSDWVPITRPTNGPVNRPITNGPSNGPRVLGILNPKLEGSRLNNNQQPPFAAFSQPSQTESTAFSAFVEADYDPEEVIATTTFESVKLTADDSEVGPTKVTLGDLTPVTSSTKMP